MQRSARSVAGLGILAWRWDAAIRAQTCFSRAASGGCVSWRPPYAKRIAQAADDELEGAIAKAAKMIGRFDRHGRELVGETLFERLAPRAADELGLPGLSESEGFREALAARLARALARGEYPRRADLLAELLAGAANDARAPEQLRAQAEELIVAELARPSSLALGLAAAIKAAADADGPEESLEPLCRRPLDRALDDDPQNTLRLRRENYRIDLKLKRAPRHPDATKVIRAVCEGRLAYPVYEQSLMSEAAKQLCREHGGTAAATRWLLEQARPKPPAEEITAMSKRARSELIAWAFNRRERVEPVRVANALARALRA